MAPVKHRKFGLLQSAASSYTAQADFQLAVKPGLKIRIYSFILFSSFTAQADFQLAVKPSLKNRICSFGFLILFSSYTAQADFQLAVCRAGGSGGWRQLFSDYFERQTRTI